MYMKNYSGQIRLLCLFLISSTVALNTCFSQAANYEASNWKTMLLNNPQGLNIVAPPGSAATKAELKNIKQRMDVLTQQELAQIQYWNAGAPAYRWNQVASRLFPQKYTSKLRMPGAWMNLAIYDATVLAWQEKVRYKRQRPSVKDRSLTTLIASPLTYSYPCEHSVTAAAAAHVLAYFLPEKADSILQLARAASQTRINAGVQYPSDVEAGWKLGEQVARQVIQKAKNDGSATAWNGEVNKDPKKWTGSFPMGISLASFTPMIMKSANQFRPPPPPDFEADMKELKEFKPTFKTNALAYYWATTADIWTELANQKMFESGMSHDAPAVARIYAVLSSAAYDAAIAIMDAKYAYWGIRPEQYDKTYKPLISTPPFPGYPSGHAVGAATSSAVLEYFFPEGAEQFQQLARDCADSRFYAGIHFRTDNEVALTMGKELGRYVVETWMKETLPSSNSLSSRNNK
jgi:membrane-associated phospholipid phosphatase